ncbi:MFS transporter [Halothiobacillus sp.]|uniref:MFS transporter n=1 Tax=Halothiobacillus sp. TaxID=1891311 RepID=UPI002629DA27|nr:MFS transporter [Halothiobacillus sp.]MDD4966118.1 MFS transporter [Halothiobacillus sp.]
MTQQHPIDWGTVATLNVVSIFSQLGQFGIGFVVLPVWLAQHGLNATELGILVSAQWLGMLLGLAIAPRLNVLFGHAKVIAMGLLVAMVAFALMLSLGQSAWLPAVVLIGLGTGLRWIGLEPWLYGIAPTQGRGRLVGFHETMIGIAPIVAPLMTNWVGIEGTGPLVLGLVFTGMAFIPLAFAGVAPKAKLAQVKRAPGQGPSPRNFILALGLATAAIGGITEAAFSGLFPIFGAGRDLGADQMVSLLTYFGLGGLLLQYLMGWLADHRGLVFAVLVNAGMTILMAIVTSFPLGFTGLAVTFFVMGGTITGYLTLAIVASTKAGHGELSVNVRLISMAYTASAIFGPLLAGFAMKSSTSEALIWLVGALGVTLCGYVLIQSRRRVLPDRLPDA